MTAEQVAIAVGVKRPTITRIENGSKKPSPELAEKLEIFFKGAVTRDQILFPKYYPETGKKSGRAQQLARAS